MPLLLTFGIATTATSAVIARLGLSQAGHVQLFNQMQSQLSRHLNSERIEQAVDKIKQSFPQYTISITGHSLGGATAEILAARVALAAVTFDSPGTQGIIDRDHQDRHYTYDPKQFISFMSAPNIINCCHPHVGTCYRLYIPHVQAGWTATHVASGLFGSASRLATAVTAGLTVAVGISICKGAPPITIAKGLAGFIGKSLAVTALPDILTQLLFRSISWTTRQHSIQNIVDCFNNDGFPHTSKVWKVQEWPHLLDRLAWSRLQRTLEYFKPFQDSNRGIHNLFDEDSVLEAQTRALPNYKVIAISNAQ